jgi:hypothetical protein
MSKLYLDDIVQGQRMEDIITRREFIMRDIPEKYNGKWTFHEKLLPFGMQKVSESEILMAAAPDGFNPDGIHVALGATRREVCPVPAYEDQDKISFAIASSCSKKSCADGGISISSSLSPNVTGVTGVTGAAGAVVAPYSSSLSVSSYSSNGSPVLAARGEIPECDDNGTDFDETDGNDISKEIKSKKTGEKNEGEEIITNKKDESKPTQHDAISLREMLVFLYREQVVPPLHTVRIIWESTCEKFDIFMKIADEMIADKVQKLNDDREKNSQHEAEATKNNIKLCLEKEKTKQMELEMKIQMAKIKNPAKNCKMVDSKYGNKKRKQETSANVSESKKPKKCAIKKVNSEREDKAREDKAREDKAREDKAREDKAREDKAHEDKAREDKAHEDKAREDKAHEDKAREDKAHEDKAREDKACEYKAHEDKAREIEKATFEEMCIHAQREATAIYQHEQNQAWAYETTEERHERVVEEAVLVQVALQYEHEAEEKRNERILEEVLRRAEQQHNNETRARLKENVDAAAIERANAREIALQAAQDTKNAEKKTADTRNVAYHVVNSACVAIKVATEYRNTDSAKQGEAEQAMEQAMGLAVIANNNLEIASQNESYIIQTQKKADKTFSDTIQHENQTNKEYKLHITNTIRSKKQQRKQKHEASKSAKEYKQKQEALEIAKEEDMQKTAEEDKRKQEDMQKTAEEDKRKQEASKRAEEYTQQEAEENKQKEAEENKQRQASKKEEKDMQKKAEEDKQKQEAYEKATEDKKEEENEQKPRKLLSYSIEKMAKVLLGDHDNLPDAPGIYFAIDSAKRVWYVGMSTSLRVRHQNHEKLGDFKTKDVQHIAYLVCEKQDLREYEVCYITKFQPSLNKQHINKVLPLVDVGYSEDQFISRYREIKLQTKLLEQEMEHLKPNLVTLLEASGGKISDENLGFTGCIVVKKTWQYSQKVQVEKATMKEAIKKLEKQEKENGTAQVTVTTFPRFSFL